MSYQTAFRCLVILLISSGLLAQEPNGPSEANSPIPRVIVIETTPDIERSEVLRKVIEALEKEGTAKRVSEDRTGKPVGFFAQISVRSNTPGESFRQLIKALQAVGIEKFSLHVSDDSESSVTITAPAAAQWRQVRQIEEVLAKHPQFESRMLVAANNDPVTPTNQPLPVPGGASGDPLSPPEGASTRGGVLPNASRPVLAANAAASAVNIYALKNVGAAPVARIVEQLYGREITVAADERTNSLILRGQGGRIQEIETLLEQLDAGPQPNSGSGGQSEMPTPGRKSQTQPPQDGPTPQAVDLYGGGSQLRGFSFNVATPQESAIELRKRCQEFDGHVQLLAEQAKGPFRDPIDGERRKQSLRGAVQQAFAARQALLRAENFELAKRLNALQQSVEMRDRVSQQIIDRRVDELLNPDKQWQWNATVPAATVPAANAASSEVTAAEPSPPGDDNKLLIRRSETSVKVEGRFDGNEEIVLVIGDPRFTAIANTAQELKDVKELKWTTPVHKAGEYVIEVRQDAVKLNGGATAPGLVFEVHNVPNTVQGTSNISFTDKDPLPNGKVVIASPKTKLLLKRKTDQVLVTVGHVELPDAPPGVPTVVPINIVIRRKAGANRVDVFEQPAAAKISGKRLATVLGKPIHEGDLNKNVSTEDNLKRLLLLPLTEHYCRQHKLDRDEELQTKIRDEKRRAMARLFVLPAELNRHLYEKHGGRVIMSPFGAVAFDGMKMWLEEREKAGDFEITDPELKAKFHQHWIQEPAGAQFASPDQIKAAFDPALTDRFIDNLAKTIESAKKASRAFPADQIKGHIASIKQRTTVAEAVTELRRITGLDFGNGVDRESRQAWLKWWEHETSCIDNAKDGLREFVLTGVITANGKPVSGANVQAHVPSKTTPNGKYQLAETLSDSSGRYVLVLGLPPFATAEDSTWKATFTVRNPPRFIADQEPVVMKLYRQKHEDTDVALVQDTLEKNNDSLFAGVPFAMNFTLRPSVKPVDSADTDDSPRIDQPVPPKSQDKLPDEKANDTQSDARSENGQTKFAIGNVSYSLPFNFPSVESILGSMPEAKSRPKIERIQCELVKYQMSDARFYPLVGQAQLVQTHFKSTITSDAGREVVYTDTSHLIRAQLETLPSRQ